MTGQPVDPVIGILGAVTRLAVTGADDATVSAELHRAFAALDDADTGRLVLAMVDYTGFLLAKAFGFDRNDLPDGMVIGFDLLHRDGDKGLEDAPPGLRWAAQAVIAAANNDDISDFIKAVTPDAQFVKEVLSAVIPLMVSTSRVVAANIARQAKASMN